MRSLAAQHRRRYARLALGASGLVLVLAFARPSDRAPAALDWLDFPVLASDGAVLTVALAAIAAVVAGAVALHARRRHDAPHPLEERLLSPWLLLAIAGVFAVGVGFLVAWVNEGEGRGAAIAAGLVGIAALAIALTAAEESFALGGVALLGAVFAGAGAAAGRAALGGDTLFGRRGIHLPDGMLFALVLGSAVYVAASAARRLLAAGLAEPPIEHALTAGAGRFELEVALPAGLDPRGAEATVVEGPRVRVGFRRLDGSPKRRVLYVVLPGPVEPDPVIELTEDGVRVILVRRHERHERS